MVVVFVCADKFGTLLPSHKLVIQPIFDLMQIEGYDCRWGQWRTPWGHIDDVEDKDISCFVTGDIGIHHDYLTKRAFFHPHGLHPSEQGYIHLGWYGCLLPGEWWRKNLKSNRLPVTGWAKLDVLFKPHIKERTITEYKLNLPYDKTVLYAPTGNWDWATSFDASVFHIIHMFEELPYNLIIKTAEYSESFKKWHEFLNYSYPKHINHIGENEDLTPLYSLCDLAITDGSSVAWEFIGLDKPTIQLTNMPDPMSALVPAKGDCERCNPVSGYFGGDDKFREHEECRTCAGVIKCSLEELRETVICAIENPNEIGDERRRWAAKVNTLIDGHSAERCVNAIKKIAGI